jgi:hypothetical protein
VNDHLPIPTATADTADGHGALTIKCTGCEYATGRQRSRKQAWADFRAHACKDITVAASPPPPGSLNTGGVVPMTFDV